MCLRVVVEVDGWGIVLRVTVTVSGLIMCLRVFPEVDSRGIVLKCDGDGKWFHLVVEGVA